MTDDIVARLRIFAKFDPDQAEAADEIERLRERRDDWRAAMTENHDLWREVERLRKVIDALEGEIRETLEMLP
jgi:predicted RNase H-like nuclease (RuvC/YqgF family)